MKGIALPQRRRVARSVRCLHGCFLGAAIVLGLSACSSSTSERKASDQKASNSNSPSSNSGNSNSGSTSSTQSAAASSVDLPEPCSLVTQAEVETALGKGATMSPVFNERIGMHECRLKPAAPGKIEVVIMVVHPAVSWDAVKKVMLPPSSDGKSLSGMGDDGFVGRAVGYNVRKGSRYVQVFGAVTNNDAANDKATHYLAEKASSRL
jgi:hypothetical protein